MKKVVFASFAKFPNGDSNAIHFTNMSCIFARLGYECFFVGFGQENYKDKFGTYFSLRKTKSNNTFGKIINHFNMGGKLVSFLKKHFYDADIVVFSDCLNKRQLRSMAAFFEKQNKKSKLLISVTEEYTRDEFDSFNYFTKKGLKRNQYLSHKFNDRRFKIICISKYIEKNFCYRGFKTLFLPFVYSNDFVPQTTPTQHDKICFLYAGSPNNKDRLLDIIKAFSLLNDNQKELIQLNIVGVDEQWLISKDIGLFKAVRPFAFFYGRVGYNHISDFYAKADFSLILRDSEKVFVKAGCPTKVIESLFYGVPPITNYFGDLNLFLSDLQNSIISKDNSVSSYKDALERAINNLYCLPKLKKQSYETAQSRFECGGFVNSMKEFIE